MNMHLPIIFVIIIIEKEQINQPMKEKIAVQTLVMLKAL